MDVETFLGTLYLGDRGCKSILIDGWHEEVKVQVDCISRVRSKTWDYDTDEDIEDGWIVFEGVKSIHFEPGGLIPNDAIHDISAERIDVDPPRYRILMSVGSVGDDAAHRTVKIHIDAESMVLEDPRQPGVRIRR